jgi:hypothetical protein
MEFITKFFMICLPFGQADFTTSAVLQTIRSEVPRLHGLRLAPAANSACEKSWLPVFYGAQFRLNKQFYEEEGQDACC